MAILHHAPLIAAAALVAALVALALLARGDASPTRSTEATETASGAASPPAVSTPTATRVPASRSTPTPTAAAPVATPAPTPAPAPAPAISLSVLGGAGRGEMVLDWTSTLTGVADWQYRVSSPGCLEPRGTWADVPSISPPPASHRVTGLIEFRLYCFQVRARTASGSYVESASVEGITALVGPDGIAQMVQPQAVEGGRTFRVAATDFVIDVPPGLPLKLGDVEINLDGSVTIVLMDAVSGSYLVQDTETGEYVVREIIAAPDESRDVNALFDQIIASTRRVPLP